MEIINFRTFIPFCPKVKNEQAANDNMIRKYEDSLTQTNYQTK